MPLQQKYKLKNISSKAKLRTIVRKLIENNWWLIKVVSEIKKRDAAEKVKNVFVECDGDFPCLEDKLVLMSSRSQRMEENLKRLANKLSFMLPFARHSVQVIQELLQFAILCGYKKGRELFRAGDGSLSAYFLVSGSVEIRQPESDDPLTKFKKRTIGGDAMTEAAITLEQGTIVGQEEILFGEKRQQSAIIIEDMLCIRFEKLAMVKTLEPMLKGWFEISRDLMKFDMFSYFEHDVIRELIQIGTIKHYLAGRLIKSSKRCNFLVAGEVSVIQRLVIEKYKANGKDHLRLYHNQETITDQVDNVEPIFMQVCVLTDRAMFGLGERMSKHIFWTNKPCKFIQYSKKEVKKYGIRSVWEETALYLDSIFPTTEEVFEFFLHGRKWLRFKKDVTDQCKKRFSRPTTIHDVPIPIRCRHMKLKKTTLEEMKILEMNNYLRGGLSILEDEMGSTIVLDKFGEMRDKLLGGSRIKPPHGANKDE